MSEDIDKHSVSNFLMDLHIAKSGVGLHVLNITRVLFYLKFIKIARIYKIMQKYDNFYEDLLTMKSF